MGAATVYATTFISATPAAASCVGHHANVEAKDASGNKYGNQGTIYVNTSSVINSLNDALYRSLRIYSNSTNYVEVGWGAGPNNITGQSNPTVFAYWINRGSDNWQSSSSLYENSNYEFDVENVGHVEIFRYHFNYNTSAFAYSPTMNFDTGLLTGNSEHWNQCDSLWTDIYALENFNSGGSWSLTWGDLECWYNSTVNSWYLHKDSDGEFHVTGNSAGALC